MLSTFSAAGPSDRSGSWVKTNEEGDSGEAGEKKTKEGKTTADRAVASAISTSKQQPSSSSGNFFTGQWKSCPARLQQDEEPKAGAARRRRRRRTRGGRGSIKVLQDQIRRPGRDSTTAPRDDDDDEEGSAGLQRRWSGSNLGSVAMEELYGADDDSEDGADVPGGILVPWRHEIAERRSASAADKNKRKTSGGGGSKRSLASNKSGGGGKKNLPAVAGADVRRRCRGDDDGDKRKAQPQGQEDGSAKQETTPRRSSSRRSVNGRGEEEGEEANRPDRLCLRPPPVFSARDAVAEALRGSDDDAALEEAPTGTTHPVAPPPARETKTQQQRIGADNGNDNDDRPKPTIVAPLAPPNEETKPRRRRIGAAAAADGPKPYIVAPLAPPAEEKPQTRALREQLRQRHQQQQEQEEEEQQQYHREDDDDDADSRRDTLTVGTADDVERFFEDMIMDDPMGASERDLLRELEAAGELEEEEEAAVATSPGSGGNPFGRRRMPF